MSASKAYDPKLKEEANYMDYHFTSFKTKGKGTMFKTNMKDTENIVGREIATGRGKDDTEGREIGTFHLEEEIQIKNGSDVD